MSFLSLALTEITSLFLNDGVNIKNPSEFLKCKYNEDCRETKLIF